MDKSLNDRVIEAHAIASLGRILSRDRRGRVTAVCVPASEATQNHVIIRRKDGGVITTECRKEAGHIGYVDCLGNLSGVCRHSLAAIIIAMRDMGYIPRFRRSLDDAKQLAKRMKDVTLSDQYGEPVVMTFQSHQGRHSKLYFVAIGVAAMELKEVA